MFNQRGKIYRIAGTVLLVSVLSCNPADQSGPTISKAADSAKLVNQPMYSTSKNASILPLKDTVYAGERDTTILVKNNEAFIIGHIIANKNQPKYTLRAQKGQSVTAIIRPLKKGGNVRINQVQQPGGAFDGPFGDSLRYTFKRTGNLRFIIGENLMAGDPYTGDFILHIRLSE